MHEPQQYIETTENNLLPPADFQPYFTLIEDTQTGEHYHPHTQYVFSDDDQDAMTSAIIDSSGTDHDSDSSHHRVILLDIDADGKIVRRAHCLSSAWHVQQASITQAPSWNEATQGTATQGMMLNISGHGQQLPHDVNAEHEQPQDAIVQMESVINGYRQGLARLQATMDAFAPVEKYAGGRPS